MALNVREADVSELDGMALMAGVSFQSSPGWWRCVISAGLKKDERAQLLLVEDDAGPVLMLPLKVMADKAWTSLSTPYTCLFQPVFRPGTDLQAVGAALARHLGPLVQLDGVNGQWPGWTPLLAGLRAGRRHSSRFESFGNWYEPVSGLGWHGYLARRPGALRETVRRKLKRVQAGQLFEFAMARTPDDAKALLVEYEQVYRKSWKEAEPYPDFAAALVREAATAGVLRFAVLRQAGAAVAAQYWIVEHGVATVLKLAHDEDARSFSPGTVLTAWMIRRLMEEEGVGELDFGRGDDPYKQQWATQRRQREGILIGDPLHHRGAMALLRQKLGQVLRRREA